MFFDGFVLFAQFLSFRIGGQASGGTEGFLSVVPVFPYGYPRMLAEEKIKRRQHGTPVSVIVPFFLMPLTGAGVEEGAVVAVDMIQDSKPHRWRWRWKFAGKGKSLADTSDGIF